MKMALDYGLELTNNSKVGWAFSLPRTETCINATSLCRKLCYGNSVRYQSAGQKAKRGRNFRTCEFLLAEGGPELLAENLSMLVNQARPRDWLTARIKRTRTAIPFTVRIHDIGDYPEFRTIPCSKISEHKIEIVNHFDSASLLQHSA